MRVRGIEWVGKAIFRAEMSCCRHGIRQHELVFSQKYHAHRYCVYNDINWLNCYFRNSGLQQTPFRERSKKTLSVRAVLSVLNNSKIWSMKIVIVAVFFSPNDTSQQRGILANSGFWEVFRMFPDSSSPMGIQNSQGLFDAEPTPNSCKIVGLRDDNCICDYSSFMALLWVVVDP